MPKETLIEGVEVKSFAGEERGRFDATHIVGAEVLKGTPAERAVDRSFRVRDVVELASPGVITTDSIRYVLDGLRDVGVGERIPVDTLRGFRDHILAQVAPDDGAPGKADGDELRLDRGQPEPAGEAGEGGTGEEAKAPGILLDGGPPMRTRTRSRSDCAFQVVSRRTRLRTVVRVKKMTVGEPQEDLYYSKDSVTTASEVQVALESKATADFSYGDFGVSSSLTGSALAKKLAEHMQSSEYVIGKWITQVSFELEIWLRAEVREVWNWVGNDCPDELGRPWVNTYTRDGKPIPVKAGTTIVYYEKKMDKDRLAEEDEVRRIAQQEAMRQLSETAVLPEPPFPDVPGPLNF